MRRGIAAFTAASAGIAALGCQTLIGADFDSARAAQGGCQLFDPPTRPADLPKAADGVTFTVVIDHLDFGDELSDAGAANPVGYDLDHLCTTAAGPPSCHQYSWLDRSPVVDGPGGRDDGVGNLFKAEQSILVGGTFIGSAEENAGIASGTAAPPGVLRISRFSGLASDDHVVVELFQAAAFDAAQPAGMGADGGGLAPHFDGSDEWPVVRDTLRAEDAGDGIESSQRDDAAFVINNGELVAHFDSLKLPMHNIYIDVSNAVLTGRLELHKTGWTLEDGMLAARLETKALLAIIPLATSSAVNVALCKSDALNYEFAKKALCQSADLPTIDGDPTSDCMYTSLGVGFQTSPASLGPVVDVVPPPTLCPSSEDPSSDSCEHETQ